MDTDRKEASLRSQKAQDRIESLRQALEEGESSGKNKPLDISSVKRAARAHMEVKR
jgi:antitoxin ParD1/3/4